MRLILLLLMLVGTAIFLIQNQQPVLIYFLGTDTETALFSLKLPLGLWVAIFTTAGILTSFFIQIITRLPRQLSTTRPSPKPPLSPPPPDLETPYQRPSDWEVVPNPEWEEANSSEEEDDDEWDIEEPPKETTIPRVGRPIKNLDFEAKQPPPQDTTSREGTVYSYTYRELRDRKTTSPEPEPKVEQPSPQPEETRSLKKTTTDQVYDAKYRIITPPYRTPSDQFGDEDEDEESWV